MFIAGSKGENHVVTLEQDAYDVNILVDGVLVAWFEGNKLVTDKILLEEIGLVHTNN